MDRDNIEILFFTWLNSVGLNPGEAQARQKPVAVGFWVEQILPCVPWWKCSLPASSDDTPWSYVSWESSPSQQTISPSLRQMVLEFAAQWILKICLICQSQRATETEIPSNWNWPLNLWVRPWRHIGHWADCAFVLWPDKPWVLPSNSCKNVQQQSWGFCFELATWSLY